MSIFFLVLFLQLLYSRVYGEWMLHYWREVICKETFWTVSCWYPLHTLGMFDVVISFFFLPANFHCHPGIWFLPKSNSLLCNKTNNSCLASSKVATSISGFWQHPLTFWDLASSFSLPQRKLSLPSYFHSMDYRSIWRFGYYHIFENRVCHICVMRDYSCITPGRIWILQREVYTLFSYKLCHLCIIVLYNVAVDVQK